MGTPPRPTTTKLLKPSGRRTAHCGRSCDSASSNSALRGARLPLRLTSGAVIDTVPGTPNGAVAVTLLADWRKNLETMVMLPPLPIWAFAVIWLPLRMTNCGSMVMLPP